MIIVNVEKKKLNEIKKYVTLRLIEMENSLFMNNDAYSYYIMNYYEKLKLNETNKNFLRKRNQVLCFCYPIKLVGTYETFEGRDLGITRTL